ncbi:OmpA family protein [Flavobacterium algicola]|uniref:OmpA family protein n=1 Tax=Flavobacterium algicola TaxID=556529 RepID=UPI001EFDDCE5|nr:OmpA family protein [Flavobacterium algicola]MCG9793478.1 OmpA family protein [Flavobacterium algicola]
MKNSISLLVIAVILFSCKDNKEEKNEIEQPTTEQQTEISNPDKVGDNNINWDEMPDLKNIGDYPFITAPEGLTISNEKEGLSEFFPFEKMQNYNGDGFFVTEGKLGVIHFSDNGFNQRYFDKSVLGYFNDLGAKKIHEGTIPTVDSIREKNKENMFTGKQRSFGISEDRNPITLYAFKNNDKSYVITVQSNSAQGEIFIMELENFRQTIKKYTSKEMLDELNADGKAILNINFETDKATLKPEGQAIVNEIYALLSSNQSLDISIEGHTDNTGSASKNKQLSDQRANTVMNTLTAKGIDIKRLKSVGFGSEKPVAPNDTEANKAKNRRVELVKFK